MRRRPNGSFTESVVEDATLVLVRKPSGSGSHAANLPGMGARPATFRTETTLDWFAELGYTVAHGPGIHMDIRLLEITA